MVARLISQNCKCEIWHWIDSMEYYGGYLVQGERLEHHLFEVVKKLCIYLFLHALSNICDDKHDAQKGRCTEYSVAVCFSGI